MNIDIRKHIIDLIPIMTLGGIFKAVIIPSWDNMTYTNPITIDPVKTALLCLGFSLVMAILYLWRHLVNQHEIKKALKNCNCDCHKKFGLSGICGQCLNSNCMRLKK